MELLVSGVFSNGFGALADRVFRQFTRKQKTDGSLDFAAGGGRALVVARKTRRFSGDAVENIVDHRIHDVHRLAGDPSVRMHLLQDFVDINRVRFLLLALLPRLVLGASAARTSLSCLSTSNRRHDDDACVRFE